MPQFGVFHTCQTLKPRHVPRNRVGRRLRNYSAGYRKRKKRRLRGFCAPEARCFGFGSLTRRDIRPRIAFLKRLCGDGNRSDYTRGQSDRSVLLVGDELAR